MLVLLDSIDCAKVRVVLWWSNHLTNHLNFAFKASNAKKLDTFNFPGPNEIRTFDLWIYNVTLYLYHHKEMLITFLPNLCIIWLFCFKHLPFLFRKISNVAPSWGTWLRTHYWGILLREDLPLAGIEPMTSRVLLSRGVLYHCATTAALESTYYLCSTRFCWTHCKSKSMMSNLT